MLIHGINAYSEDSCLGLPPLCRRCTVDCKSRRLFFFILRGFALPLDKSLSSSDEPLELDLTSAFSGLKKEVKLSYELQSHYLNLVEQDTLLTGCLLKIYVVDRKCNLGQNFITLHLQSTQHLLLHFIRVHTGYSNKFSGLGTTYLIIMYKLISVRVYVPAV